MGVKIKILLILNKDSPVTCDHSSVGQFPNQCGPPGLKEVSNRRC